MAGDVDIGRTRRSPIFCLHMTTLGGNVLIDCGTLQLLVLSFQLSSTVVLLQFYLSLLPPNNSISLKYG